ncbi:Transcription regulator AsnC-type [Pyrolobus fumarii 1A]|uniref:Transcription regulator AsnC-type n=1 Tax=Pyrolobus fumarii (strain DSM 11204 / 1A) TaxID=694429 RepID=G0EDN3_PYRF1|nr:Lrp/AsnC ligand binding domain-containing protein [Pyrolobus fumarii]AEM39837.1 Transcription regulator AsnC-type [Pyrolobus fumarii 1A]
MPVAAFVLLLVQVGKEYEIAEQIKEAAKKAGVDAEVYVVYGEYDIVVKVRAENLSQIDMFVTHIRRLPGVTRTVTLISSA